MHDCSISNMLRTLFVSQLSSTVTCTRRTVHLMLKCMYMLSPHIGIRIPCSLNNIHLWRLLHVYQDIYLILTILSSAMAQISDAHVLKMSAARDLVLMLYS